MDIKDMVILLLIVFMVLNFFILIIFVWGYFRYKMVDVIYIGWVMSFVYKLVRVNLFKMMGKGVCEKFFF